MIIKFLIKDIRKFNSLKQIKFTINRSGNAKIKIPDKAKINASNLATKSTVSNSCELGLFGCLVVNM